MFRSQARPINTPQFEHARLAAWLAAHWGNADLPHPPIAPDTLIRGVLMHDRGYGTLDDWPLRDIPDELWDEIMERGFREDSGDPLVDQIVRLHINRLRQLAAPEGPAGYPWAWIDAVTNLCDRLSLEYCFEAPSRKELTVEMHDGPVTFTYGVASRGHLFCSPWPFSEPEVKGMILGYQREGYPTKLEPVVLPFTCAAAS